MSQRSLRRTQTRRVFMLMVLAIALGLVSIPQAQARPGVHSSWERIFDFGYRPKMPQISFGDVSVPINGVCLSGETLHSRSPHEECTRYEWRDSERVCTRLGLVHLTTPRRSLERICLEHSDEAEGLCLAETTVDLVHPLTYLVDVVAKHEGQPERLLFRKKFHIPNCE